MTGTKRRDRHAPQGQSIVTDAPVGAETELAARAERARRAFDELSARIAATAVFDGDANASDLELLEEATALVREAR